MKSSNLAYSHKSQSKSKLSKCPPCLIPYIPESLLERGKLKLNIHVNSLKKLIHNFNLWNTVNRILNKFQWFLFMIYPLYYVKQQMFILIVHITKQLAYITIPFYQRIPQNIWKKERNVVTIKGVEYKKFIWDPSIPISGGLYNRKLERKQKCSLLVNAFVWIISPVYPWVERRENTENNIRALLEELVKVYCFTEAVASGRKDGGIRRWKSVVKCSWNMRTNRRVFRSVFWLFVKASDIMSFLCWDRANERMLDIV